MKIKKFSASPLRRDLNKSYAKYFETAASRGRHGMLDVSFQ